MRTAGGSWIVLSMVGTMSNGWTRMQPIAISVAVEVDLELLCHQSNCSLIDIQ